MTGVDIYYQISGPPTAPVVVLSNSLATTLDMWDPQVADLGSQFRLIRYDHRGHGRSPVPPGPYRIADLATDVLALLDRLDLERVSFCGLSIGGMVGMWLAAHAPQRIDKLVLCCTASTLPADPWLARAEDVRARGTAALAEATIERWFTAEFRRRQPEVVDRIRAQIAATPDQGYAACCAALAGVDLRHELSRIRADTLVLSGANDPALPPPYGAEIVAGIVAGGGRARLEVVPDAGHLANLEQPKLVNTLLREHLSGAASPRAPK